MTTTKISQPKTCSRCAGTGDYATGRSCFKCAGLGVVEGDAAVLSAGKARAALIAAGHKALNGLLANADAETAWAARCGFRQLEAEDAERFAKACTSAVNVHPALVAALVAYAHD